MVPKIALDTNILVYATDSSSPWFEVCDNFLKQVDAGKVDLYLIDKTLYEFYAVISKTLFKKDLAQAQETFDFYLTQTNYTLLTSSINTPKTVSYLLKLTSGSGKYIHDLVLAAILLENDIELLLTVNEKDFEGIPGLQTISPENFV